MNAKVVVQLLGGGILGRLVLVARPVSVLPRKVEVTALYPDGNAVVAVGIEAYDGDIIEILDSDCVIALDHLAPNRLVECGTGGFVNLRPSELF